MNCTLSKVEKREAGLRAYLPSRASCLSLRRSTTREPTLKNESRHARQCCLQDPVERYQSGRCRSSMSAAFEHSSRSSSCRVSASVSARALAHSFLFPSWPEHRVVATGAWPQRYKHLLRQQAVGTTSLLIAIAACSA